MADPNLSSARTSTSHDMLLALAQRADVAVDTVKRLYDEAKQSLMSQATITTFVDVLAIRRVQHALHIHTTRYR